MKGLWCFAGAVLVASSVASAAPKGYEPKYAGAVKMENSGDLVGALATFESIPKESRDFDTRLHIAGCKKKLGRLLEAQQDYESIRTDPKADAPTRDTAASDLEDLGGRIPKVRVTVSERSSGVFVTLDGHETTTPATVLVNPGPHVVVAKRGPSIVFERTVDVAEATTINIEVDAPAPPSSTSVGKESSPGTATPSAAPVGTALAARVRPPIGALGILSQYSVTLVTYAYPSSQ